MGTTKRKYNATLVRFRRQFKKPLRNVLSVMPDGFTGAMFISEFKVLYAYLWDDICAKSREYNRKDRGLEKKGFPKRYYFPSPNNYLKKIATPIINNKALFYQLKKEVKQPEERKAMLLQQCKEKQDKRKKQLNTNLKYIQIAKPAYSNYYIKTYFKIKHSNPTDVDTRYSILLEASKYKTTETIKFLHKVNASERNFSLRHFAFTSLQKFGIKEVYLYKNRKRKRKCDDIKPTLIDTPDNLLQYIYKSQLEMMKSYDLFLSHSYENSEEVLQIKAMLNSSNINVYVDWLNDREALKRELVNQSTAGVIIERMKVSKALMYIYTDTTSQWAPWELGYFHAQSGKICIYNPQRINLIPYLELYPTVELGNDNKFYVKMEEELVELKRWISRQ